MSKGVMIDYKQSQTYFGIVKKKKKINSHMTISNFEWT